MKRNRTLSLVLTFVMILSTAVIPTYAESNVQYTEADLHEMITYADAVAAGHVNRLKDEENMNTLIFANEDNTKTMYYYGEDIKYTDEDGNVRDKTNELTYSGGVYVNEDNDINVAIPTSLSSGVTLTYDDIEITMTPEFVGAGSLTGNSPTANLNSTPRGQADSVTYNAVFGSGISVRYTPMYSGIKEDIILSSYTGTYSFDFVIETNGLIMLPDTVLKEAEAELADGITDDDTATLVTPPNWYFATREDPLTPIATLSEIYIYDSVGNAALGSVTVEQLSQTEYTLTVHADKEFLEAETTVYPVVVDPSVTIYTTTCVVEDATLNGLYPNNNYGTTGTLTVGGSYGAYSVLRFTGLVSNSTFSSLESAQIMDASIRLYCTSKGTSNPTLYLNRFEPASAISGIYWNESTITYNKHGVSYAGSSADPSASKVVSATGLQIISATSIVKSWADSDASIRKGVLLRFSGTQLNNSSYSAIFASSEATNTANRPYMMINYTQDGIYKLVNVGTGKALNNSSGATINATTYSTNNDVVEQTFRVSYNSSENGFAIYALNDSYGYGRILGQDSNDAGDVSLQNDTTVSSNNWNLIYVSTNVYWIRLNGSSTAYYLSSTSGGDVYLKNTYSTTNERWRFEYIDDDGCASVEGVEYYRQIGHTNCSSACIRMILTKYNIYESEDDIREKQDTISSTTGNPYHLLLTVQQTLNEYFVENELDFSYTNQSLSTNSKKMYQILKSLKAGNPVACIVDPSNTNYMYESGSTSHYVLITGIIYDTEFKFIVYDPNYSADNTDEIYEHSTEKLFSCFNWNYLLYSEY